MAATKRRFNIHTRKKLHTRTILKAKNKKKDDTNLRRDREWHEPVKMQRRQVESEAKFEMEDKMKFVICLPSIFYRYRKGLMREDRIGITT